MASTRSALMGLLAGLVLVAAAHAGPAGPEVTQGALQVLGQPGEPLREFPLEHTDVVADVAGMVAHVTVTQRFGNPYQEPIEAVYVFPLPQNAAVNDMVMKIGERTIRGLIKKREEAKRIYEEAKAAGKRAALLEQERPNIFTQSVANILPGDTVLITIKYVQDLKYDHGVYEFVFPMVVGPRYIPGSPVGRTGGGWAPDTDEVPDASRITPPVLRPGERSGHDIALELRLNAGVPIRGLRCTSHQVTVVSTGPSGAGVRLSPLDRIPNKDFILKYEVVGDKPEMALLAHRAEGSGYFMLMIQPKASYTPEEITAKEMIFVVDCSGSMSGEPIAKAKQAMRRFLRGLQPKDTFQVIRFSVTASGLSPQPLPATLENVERGLSYIDGLSGGGGTQMIEGIKAALDYPADPERLRIVAFMTDGYIGNETAILAAIEEKRREARLFAFGVGSSVNRYLLEGMARAGRGDVQFVRPDEETEQVVERFYERISKPYLTDLEVDWKELDVANVEPARIPDLFAAQPVIIKGRYQNPGQEEIVVRGRLAGKPWSQRLKVTLPEREPEHEALGTLWARARIRAFMDRMWRGEQPEIVEQITATALEFRLMSAYTSFVAVEEKVVTEGGETRTVQVPVPMPEGVSYEGVFGEAAPGIPMLSSLPVTGALFAAPAGPAAPRRKSGLGYGTAGHVVTALPVGDRGSAQTAWLWHLRHSGGGSSALQGVNSLVVEGSKVITLRTSGALGVADAKDLKALPQDSPLRMAFVTGTGPVAWSEDDIAALAAWLRGGGFLVVDSGGGAFYHSVVAALRQTLPEAEFKRIALSHEVFAGAKVPYRMADGCPTFGSVEAAGPAQGFYLDGELVAFVSRGRLATAWDGARSEQTEPAYRMGINLLSHALQR